MWTAYKSAFTSFFVSLKFQREEPLNYWSSRVLPKVGGWVNEVDKFIFTLTNKRAMTLFWVAQQKVNRRQMVMILPRGNKKCVCVCVCVKREWERERTRGRGREEKRKSDWVRERKSEKLKGRELGSTQRLGKAF